MVSANCIALTPAVKTGSYHSWENKSWHAFTIPDQRMWLKSMIAPWQSYSLWTHDSISCTRLPGPEACHARGTYYGAGILNSLLLHPSEDLPEYPKWHQPSVGDSALPESSKQIDRRWFGCRYLPLGLLMPCTLCLTKKYNSYSLVVHLLRVLLISYQLLLHIYVPLISWRSEHQPAPCSRFLAGMISLAELFICRFAVDIDVLWTAVDMMEFAMSYWRYMAWKSTLFSCCGTPQRSIFSLLAMCGIHSFSPPLERNHSIMRNAVSCERKRSIRCVAMNAGWI